ncbi:MAG: hypothetical protein ACRD18_17045, partial [Terriglobia bacterium]
WCCSMRVLKSGSCGVRRTGQNSSGRSALSGTASGVVSTSTAAVFQGLARYRDAASTYKVDTEAIANKVRQEFAAKEKAKRTTQPAAKAAKKAA